MMTREQEAAWKSERQLHLMLKAFYKANDRSEDFLQEGEALLNRIMELNDQAKIDDAKYNAWRQDYVKYFSSFSTR